MRIYKEFLFMVFKTPSFPLSGEVDLMPKSAFSSSESSTAFKIIMNKNTLTMNKTITQSICNISLI